MLAPFELDGIAEIFRQGWLEWEVFGRYASIPVRLFEWEEFWAIRAFQCSVQMLDFFQGSGWAGCPDDTVAEKPCFSHSLCRIEFVFRMHRADEMVGWLAIIMASTLCP